MNFRSIVIFFVFSISLLSCNSFSLLSSLNYEGTITDSSGQAIAAVVVTNGYDVVQSDEEGFFRVRKRIACRFVTLSMPSGYRSESYFLPVDKERIAYDFELIPYELSGGDSVSFVHLTDTETAVEGDWIADVKNYAKANQSAFIIHTGDICYEDGLNFHAENVNSETMELPVYYIIGNHDLVDGKYGEELYESLFGPTYYSFNAGGVHFVVTPMLKGDANPSYSKTQVANWLAQDLAMVEKGTPLIVFNHDLYTFDDDFDYGGVNLTDYNLIAWVYGHWHINYFKEHAPGIVSWTTAPPKGGIDHSAANFRIVSVDNTGNFEMENRYPYFNKHIVLPVAGMAIIYDTVSDPDSIRYTTYRGDVEVESLPMTQVSLMAWEAVLTDYDVDGARIQVTFQDGTSADKTVDSFSDKLKLLASSGAEIFMTAPLLADGKLFTATQDDSGSKNHHIMAFNADTGAFLWKYQAKQSIRNRLEYYQGKICAVDADSRIYILNAADGTLFKEVPTEMSQLGQNMGGCAREGATLFAGFGEALKSVNIETGAVNWVNKDWSGGEGTVAVPMVINGVLLAGSHWRALHAHDAATGKELWTLSENGLSSQESTPIIDGNRIISLNKQYLNIIDPVKGEFISSYETGFSYYINGSPLVDGSKIYCPTSSSGVVALNLSDGSTLWQYKTGDALIYTSPYSWRGDSAVSTVEGSPIQIDDKLYFGASDGFIHCINSADGSSVWTIEVGAAVISSLTYDGSKLYANDFAGNIWSITP